MSEEQPRCELCLEQRPDAQAFMKKFHDFYEGGGDWEVLCCEDCSQMNLQDAFDFHRTLLETKRLARGKIGETK